MPDRIASDARHSKASISSFCEAGTVSGTVLIVATAPTVLQAVISEPKKRGHKKCVPGLEKASGFTDSEKRRINAAVASLGESLWVVAAQRGLMDPKL